MQKSTFRLLRSLSLARVGLAPALIILLLSAGAPRLGAQSDNFNDDGDIPPGTNAAPGWATYSLGSLDAPGWDPPYIADAIFSFPPSPAGPDGNYAYRIYAPPITYDVFGYGPSRAGSFRTDAKYGANDGVTTFGRFSVGADVVAWNTNSGNWRDQVFGLCWYACDTNLMTTKGYFGGWGPALGTLGIIAVDLGAGGAGNINAAFAIAGLAAPESSYALDPTHQYRLQASSHDGETFLVQLFDLAQPNSPWLAAITDDTTYLGSNGYCGVFEANYDLPPPDPTGNNTNAGADVTWDNYSAYLPAAGALPAVVTDLSPQPAGKVPGYYPTVNVGILNRDTTVNQDTIRLYLDGVQIPTNSPYLTIDRDYVYKPANPTTGGPGAPWPTNYPGATVTYLMTNLFKYGTLHTNSIVFRDYPTGTYFTNTWSWTATALTPFATNGSLSVRGFDARLVQSWGGAGNYPTYANIDDANGGIPNTVASAQAVLNYQYAVSFAATNWVQLVNFDRDPTDTQMFNGNALTNFPGLCIPASASNPDYVDSFAVEVFAYLQLPAGTNWFYVDSDDAVGVYTGTNLTDTSKELLHYDGVTHQSFSWYVPVAGLYPVHILMEEGWGGAYLGLCTLNLTAGTTNVVNSASSSVQAFYPLVVESAPTIKGPYTVDAAANAGNQLTTVPALCQSGTGTITNLTVTGGTITVPASGPPKYYRLDGPRATRFTGAKKVGSNVVITYQAN